MIDMKRIIAYRFTHCALMLFLMLAMSVFQAMACGGPDYWMYMKIRLQVEPTGAGNVYASTDQSVAQNSNNCVPAPSDWYTSTHESHITGGTTLWYINTKCNDLERYAFEGWRDDTNGGVIVSTVANPETGFHDNGVYASSTENGEGGKTTESPYYPPNPFNPTLVMTAVYHKISRAVIAKSNIASAGDVSVTKIEANVPNMHQLDNAVGDKVEIKAWPLGYKSKFLGWYKDGTLVSTEATYSFVITDENQGTYMAHFSTGHDFLRIKSKVGQRYINGINDQGDVNDFSSLQLISNGEEYSAGTIFQIKDWTVTGGHPYALIVQGFSTESIYDTQQGHGVYATMQQNTSDNTWRIFANNSFFYMGDLGGGNVEVSYDNAAEDNKWYYELIDKNLETCENYFSLDPEKLIRVGNAYYTTLRTSWNILFNPEQMTPYVVTSVNDVSDGTFEMEPITGNIIPLGTPVIIKTKSTDIVENRMIPTKTNAASGAVPTGNLLQASEKYFPNQSVNTSGNYKKLMLNDAGQLSFGGNALSQVNGNEAYLCVANEVSTATDVKLAELVSMEPSRARYRITDLTAVQILDERGLIICKDDNGYANEDVLSDDEWIDYMRTVSGLVPSTTVYDQSNWIVLQLPEGKQLTTDQMLAINNHHLTDVKGVLLNKENPTFQLDVVPTGSGDEVQSTLNTYIAASFGGTQESPVNHNTYFFVQPKPMELANIEWAYWDGSKFTAPPRFVGDDGQNWNLANLHGEFGFNNEFLTADLVQGNVYQMPNALIRVLNSSKYPNRADSQSKQYEVSPTSLTMEGSYINGVITGVTPLNGTRQVAGVEYYNLAGMRSDRPWQGVNIIVTRYTDGTMQTAKAVQ